MMLPESYLSGLFTLAAVVFLFIVLAFLMKFMQRRLPTSLVGSKRLVISDHLIIDNQTKFVIIHKDHKHHLVLLSPHGNLVIESDEDKK